MFDAAYVIGVVFLATLIRSAFGFGEALFAVPLLAFVLPLPVAAPLAVLVSITIAAVVVAQDWRQVHYRSAGGLVLATLVGIPLGVWLLASPYQNAVKLALGALILAFALFSLRRKKALAGREDSRKWLLGCGFAAGVLGGAYGMNGPPLVVYGTLRGWSPQRFRATLQAYFLPASLVGMAGYWLAGLWVGEVTHLYLLALPALLPAIWLGRLANRRIAGDSFQRCLYIALALVGLVLLAQAARP